MTEKHDGGGAWAPAEFLIALPRGPETRPGYIYRGLGMHIAEQDELGTTWALTHLNSGHRVVAIDGDVQTAFPIATAVAECADWSFVGLCGWKNSQPDLVERFRETVQPFPNCFRLGSGHSEEVAQAVAAEAAV